MPTTPPINRQRPTTPTPPRTPRPLTDALMARWKALMERHTITHREMAETLDTNVPSISEWQSGRRSAPNGEMTLKILAVCDAKEPRLSKEPEYKRLVRELKALKAAAAKPGSHSHANEGY